ncbi:MULTISPECIES: glycosyltransferase family 2 protein [Planktothrix]|jgi:glycosyltransferase involved in cell wall biosynthesis|uniref:Glycosyl transferase family protein n=2 Tax=Planktothrix TaxID=54304 RepID=A0A4P5ZG59_PLAAG|nr:MULTISPECIES: glycosyltransferase family 2 protein [Planktothrix]GDZ94054.1 glycosyl transferase family protein [Planktothrix agardhii CCAP 1459/11A]CAC5340305.1 Glycosyl transferase 2 family protein [Planktothrix rubescens NIVA-CYA 18]CAD5922805.1 Lipopolysaccharide core biosynthesis glycosyltransferase KdtX [Planktothrix rubescens]CAD5944175.1 Lipopolysaccharide core biosynthesis glycosyltransferase KdtX [Planktothrix rubescens NIVA-CYA 18]
MFSIYILTANEEIDIADCIESALLSDDVIVVDSLSQDRTVEIAQQYPVRVLQHRFESHGKQRTWMLQEIPTKHDWVYILEADERMTPELFTECLQAIQSDDYIGYYVAERVIFLGNWIRRSTQYPRYQMRLFRKDKVWFNDYGHTEREVCDGPTGFIQETYPHYTCSKGLSRWIDKHNRYSTDEAVETMRQLQTGTVNWKDLLLGSSEVERRRALKDLSLRLPFRPLIRFVYMYFLLGGFLDGRSGFSWCVLQAFYEYLILLKVWEVENSPQLYDLGLETSKKVESQNVISNLGTSDS